MRRSILTAALATLAAGFSGSASAADLPVKAAPVAVAAAYNWTGFYVGVQGGIGRGRVTWDYVPTSANDENHNTSGWLVGGTLGYNRHLAPNWVIGIEADLAGANIKGGTSCPNPAFRCQTKIDALGTLRGRLGYAWSSALLYVTGGGAWSRLRAETVQLAGVATPPSGTPVNGQTLSSVGWTLGAGLEWGLAPNWSVKAEYLYMSFGAKNYNIDSGLVVNVKENVSVARAGINYRFGPR